MGIGTSLGAFFPDQFMFESGQQKKFEAPDKGVKKPEDVETDKELDQLEQSADGMGIPAQYLGPKPADDSPEWKDWQDTWSEIYSLKNRGMTPEQFMKKAPPDMEGVYDQDKDMFWMRKRVRPGKDKDESVPMSGLPVVQVGMKEWPTTIWPHGLFGTGGHARHKTWPERIAESGQNLAGDVLSGAEPTWDMDPVTGEWHTSAKVIERAQDMSAFALGGSVAHKPATSKAMPDRSLAEKSQSLDSIDAAVRNIREQQRNPQTLGETNPYAETAGQFIDDYFNAVRRSERVSREMGHSQEPTANPVGRATVDETERALEAIRAALEDVEGPRTSAGQNARAIADEARRLREGLEATDPRRNNIRTDEEVAAMNNRDFHDWYGSVSYQRLNNALIDRHSAILNRRHELGRLNGDEFIARFDTMNANMEPMAARHVRRYEQLTGRRPEGYSAEEMARPNPWRSSDGFDQIPFEDTAPTERIPVRRSTRNAEDDQALIDLFAQSDTQTGTKYPEKFQKRIDEAKVGEKINFFSKPAEERYGKFYFANEKGVGEVNASYFTDKKEIRIGSIGLIQDKKGNKINPLGPYSKKHGPQTFGKETRSIIKKLKETYPDAQWISGFRVTGARQKTGGGSAEAKMWIGKGKKPDETSMNDWQRMEDDLSSMLRRDEE